jgi:hypothetical protein
VQGIFWYRHFQTGISHEIAKPKKMMAKNFRRPAYEKSKKIHCVLFIALHFYFICQLSKFLLLFLCQSAKFISKFRSYAQSRNWITQKGEVSILVVCFFFFFPIVTHMFKVMKVDVKWLYAKMRDREKIRPSNIRDLSKSQPTSLFDSPVIYQLCVCNIFIRFVPIKRNYAQSSLGCRLGVFSQVLLKFSFPENLFRFFLCVCVTHKWVPRPCHQVLSARFFPPFDPLERLMSN